MNLPDPEVLLEMLSRAVNTDGTVNVELVKAVYAMLAPQYRPILDQIPELVGIFAEDLGKINEVLVNAVLEVADSTGAVNARNKLLKRKTENRFAILQAYKLAGFTLDQAMSLLLTDITNVKIARANTLASGRNITNKRRTTTRQAA